MYKVTVCLMMVVITCSHLSFSQNLDFQTLEEQELQQLWNKTQPKIPLIENAVFKNIFLYRLTLIPTIKNITDLTYLKTNNNIIDSLLPDYNTKPDILITPCNDFYDRNNYICLYIAFSESGSLPDTYPYYHHFFPYDNDFLIAFNPINNDIDFLSGNFYKSQIDIRYHGKNIYDEYKNNPNSKEYNLLKMNLYAYIHFRLYQFRVKNIKESGIDANTISYTAYSDVLDQRITIKISLKNFLETQAGFLNYNGNFDVLFYKDNVKYVFPLVVNPKSYEDIRVRPVN